MQNRWVAWLLVAMVGIQVYTVTQLNELKRTSRSTESALRSQLNTLQNRVGNLSNELTQMARANEWLISPQVKVEVQPECAGVSVRADWSFRELGANPEVSLLYRKSGEANWTTLQAAQTGSLSYGASFTLPFTPRTEMMYEVVRHNRNSAGRMAPTTEANTPEGRFEYRIVARSGGTEQSSDVRPLHAGHLVGRFHIQTTILSENRYQVSLLPKFKPEREMSCFALEGALLRGYAGGQLVAEAALDASRSPDTLWAEIKPAQPLERLDLVLKFKTGREEVHTVPLR